MQRMLRIVACCAFASLASLEARADEHPYTEGQVIDVTRVRTEFGHFEDYMKYLAKTWIPEQELAKKAGYIEGYEVLMNEPRRADDPDVVLVVRYKNFAAMDGWIAKGDEIEKKVEGSMSAADKAAIARGKIRRVLGSTTEQILNLK